MGIHGALQRRGRRIYAVGAYTSALLTGPPTSERLGGLAWPIAAGWVSAALVAGAVALAVGAITLRLRHDYLAIATFGIAVTIQLLATNLVRLTGGPFGIHGVPRPFAESVASPLGRNVAYLAVVVGLVAAVYVALERLVRSPSGRVLRALREDETAAAALGKSAPAFRLQAFVIGAMVMGLAGAVYPHFVGFVAPEDFLPILTFQIWTMLVLGGSGNNRGALVGALAVWALWSASGAALAAPAPGVAGAWCGAPDRSHRRRAGGGAARQAARPAGRGDRRVAPRAPGVNSRRGRTGRAPDHRAREIGFTVPRDVPRPAARRVPPRPAGAGEASLGVLCSRGPVRGTALTSSWRSTRRLTRSIRMMSRHAGSGHVTRVSVSIQSAG